MVNRCTGHCCRAFVLPMSPSSLRRLAASTVLNGDPDEGRKLVEMVIYLGPAERPDTEEPGPDDGVQRPMVHVYTCKHFDGATGDCRNYEQRPNLCRDHPGNAECGYRGCTLPGRRDPSRAQ